VTEFQRFVSATTGQALPIYGSSLFGAQPASFGPLEHAPAPSNLVVGAEDELRIRIWGQINFSANLRVSREGEIYLPKAGAVHVAGLPFSAVAGQLRQALDRVYRNYELSVDMGEIHSIQVYVAGQARRPGEYTVSALSTLVDAIFLSGGPASSGSMRHVQLKRAGKVVTDFDLYALLVNGDKSNDAQLEPGDVLFIPSTGPQVALLGSVRLAAIYELRGAESVAALLETAGGRTAMAAGAQLSIERIEDHARRHAFEVAANAEGLATLLTDGDIVRIDPIVSSYRDSVTLRGSVANPGHFRWHQGMRLSELLPERDALLSRNYWWRRTQLGLPAPEFVAAGGAVSGDFAASGARSTGSAGALAVTRADSSLEAQTGLLRPAAQTDWNYAVVERLDPATMTTSLLSFNLGKLVLDHDASQDLELQPGDAVTIFSLDDIHQPIDKQTKYVRLEGEIAHPGVYSVTPEETLRSVVARAGGLTSKAYLYGADFTRRSTQALEQQRLNEYAEHLEHQLARNAMALAETASTTSQPDSKQGDIASVSQELVARLRQIRPTGRIVLNLHPRSAGDNELPEEPLEDGDRLLVPPVPTTIQVIGAVFNQNAFRYGDGARLGEYLRMAGGPSREADRGQIFVLRADGSVTSRGAAPSLFYSGFDNVRLFPGDTIVVPEKNVGIGAMHELISWTQIFSQFALGAAAINVIK
jgi:polysaccharide export outer membrane protein